MQPDFIGIGAQKAGTSWIYACLDDHPDIYAPVKEIHFFSKQDVYGRGLDWYCRHFVGKNSRQVAGEYSTTYLHSDQALERIARAFPQVKIIISLRDPLSRARSHFGNDVKAGIIPKDTDMAKTLSSRTEYIERGFYADKVAWLFDTFGRDRVLVLILEDSYVDPIKFIGSIFRFLGVDEQFSPPTLHQKVNIAEVPRSLMLGKFFDRLSAVLRALRLGGVIRVLRHIQVIEFLRRLNRKRTISPSSEPDWDPSTISRLETDRLTLEGLLERPLVWTSARLASKTDVQVGR